MILKNFKKIVSLISVIAMLVSCITVSVINVSAADESPYLIYFNDFDGFADKSGLDTGIFGEEGNTMTREHNAGNEKAYNGGIVKNTGAGNAGVDKPDFHFTFGEAKTSGKVCWSLDFGRNGNGTLTGNAPLSVWNQQKWYMAYVNYDSIFGPNGKNGTGNPNASGGSLVKVGDWSEGAVSHIRQVIDLDGRKTYTYVNGELMEITLYTPYGGFDGSLKDLRFCMSDWLYIRSQ